jgi:hypothetical protein
LIQVAAPGQLMLPRAERACFTAAERRLLLATPGIGHGVIERIECAGVHSLQQLRDLGVDSVVDHICEGEGNLAWRNRKRALLRALAAVGEAQPALSD